MNTTLDPRWVTIPTAADCLKVSTKTIRRMIARGEIEARRIGPRLIRVRMDKLDSLGQPLAWNGGDK
ncbi:helix-turn-helix domain-containing protein [Pseudoclavibacter alba]|uniref:Helix-turn-helix domain-containing protein n=1 Tax=Pseudoclavibacter albus TaxID=272241 RepID=A0ABT2HUV7_9MICO|nr:helix-turn-helix domain-containing protein [Pseudoclavibacter alba]MCT2041926.1 helix-turn-helix domain-containing protein [Pseudoclavibacter alba]